MNRAYRVSTPTEQAAQLAGQIRWQIGGAIGCGTKSLVGNSFSDRKSAPIFDVYANPISTQ